MSIETIPNFENEPIEPFNRADCVRHTVRTFLPFPALLGQGLELRYLPDDIYMKPGEYPRLHSLDAAVAQRMSQFTDPGVELTDRKLDEFDQEEMQSLRAFGPTVVIHARQFGLVETLNPDQAKARLAPHVNLARFVNNEYGNFRFSGWDIFPDAEYRSKPVLLVPSRSEEGQVSFETVKLDDLHALDPEFLPQLIRDYEEKFATHVMANLVRHNLNLHVVPEAELLPEYMRELAKITDPEQHERTIQSMKTYMTWLVRLGYDYEDIVYDFKLGLSGKHTGGDVSSVYIRNYLEHMAECPTQPEETHQGSNVTAQVYDALLSVNHNAEPSSQQTVSEVIRVLREPEIHTVYLDRAEVRNVADKEQAQRIIDFITKTGSIIDQRQLLEALQQELPDFHDTVVRFQKWLGIDYFQKSMFDRLISGIERIISYKDGEFNLGKLNETLRKELKNAASLAIGEFDGVIINHSLNEGALLSNQHLEAVLPLLSIKQAEVEARRGDELIGSSYERRVQRTQRLTEELAQSYREKIKTADTALQDIAKDKAAVAFFKEQTGITNQEIAHFIELTTLEDREDDHDFDSKVDFNLLTGLMTALVLEKQELVNDMRSPAFKELLKSLFPNQPEGIWKNL